MQVFFFFLAAETVAHMVSLGLIKTALREGAAPLGVFDSIIPPPPDKKKKEMQVFFNFNNTLIHLFVASIKK